MNYKNLIQEIVDLEWGKATPGDIILLSLCTAKEFAESLRLGLKFYQNAY